MSMWKILLIAIAAGIGVSVGLVWGYENWKKQQGWCVKINPDGSEKVLYGADCKRKPPKDIGKQRVSLLYIEN